MATPLITPPPQIQRRMDQFPTLMCPKKKRTHFACEPASLSSWFVPRYSTNSQPKMIIYLEQKQKQKCCLAELLLSASLRKIQIHSNFGLKVVSKLPVLFRFHFFFYFGALAFLFRSPDSRQLKQIGHPERGTKSLRSEWHRTFDEGPKYRFLASLSLWAWPRGSAERKIGADGDYIKMFLHLLQQMPLFYNRLTLILMRLPS